MATLGDISPSPFTSVVIKSGELKSVGKGVVFPRRTAKKPSLTLTELCVSDQIAVPPVELAYRRNVKLKVPL